MYGGVGVYFHAFLTSALDGGEWSASRHGRFNSGSYCIGGWVGLRVGLDVTEKRKNLLPLPGIEARLLGRLAPYFSRYTD
jgi:hypothetical protein